MIQQRIVVEVQDQEKADLLYQLLDALDFVTCISTEDIHEEKPRQLDMETHSQEFFSYAGLWAEHDVTITSIRQKAWPRHQ
ncbi:hypothetical protein GF339_13290 [candidate division KSB3 bacterium]|uniref:Uncharacterized protein n=1 Tax=candidate division KSB3 bacterium TaxID=2044937 RepID=A0A9D5Q6N2_9BACT|nr:hypothetical protein [candidate division KSB3 bacterium]MBD3325558.1 hypothetical protein [candidate division KSB3 bacterium]